MNFVHPFPHVSTLDKAMPDTYIICIYTIIYIYDHICFPAHPFPILFIGWSPMFPFAVNTEIRGSIVFWRVARITGFQRPSNRRVLFIEVMSVLVCFQTKFFLCVTMCVSNCFYFLANSFSMLVFHPGNSER